MQYALVGSDIIMFNKPEMIISVDNLSLKIGTPTQHRRFWERQTTARDVLARPLRRGPSGFT